VIFTFYKKAFCIALVLFTVNISFGQKWLWVNAATNQDTSTRCVPWATATDTAGNVIVAGGYTGVTTFGTYTLNSNFKSPFAAFMLIKYTATGNVLWAESSVTRPPDSWCFAYSVATDKAGNAYATGLFFDSVGFGPYTISSVTSNVFLVKYDPNGNVQWIRTATLNSGQSNAQANYVTVDANGNPYITGIFQDTISFGGHILTNGTLLHNAFIAKYDANGNILWAQSPTCSNCSAEGSGLAADQFGNVYEAGNYAGGSTISFGASTLSKTNSGNMFLTKYDGNGNVLWAANANIPSNASAIISSPGEYITTDAANNIYIAGNYIDTITIGSQTLITGLFNGYGNAFVAKYSSTGSPVWAKSGAVPKSGGFAVDYSITSDKWNNIYLSGEFDQGLTFGGISLSATKGGGPSFLFKLDSAGNAICGTSVNNQKSSSVSASVSGHNSVAADPKGANVYFTGDIQGYNQCVFGSDTAKGIGEIIGFLSKWTCGTCTVAPDITGTTTICSGLPITLTASGGVSYLWNNGATTDSLTAYPSSSQKYYVSITNDSCSRNDSIAITVNPTPTVNINNNQSICAGNTVNLFAGGGTFYSWQPPAGLSSTIVANPTAKPSSTTIYTVTVSSGLCSAKDSTNIIVTPMPMINACCDTTISPGQNVQLTSTGGGTYLWEPSDALTCSTCSNPIASPLVSTIYTLTVTSDSGCTATTTITIDVTCGTVFIPQAFSPNGDGQNDVLYVRGDCIKTLSFEIFDRWGNKIFETDDKYTGWDGEYKGQAMNTGTYVYYMTATNYDGSTINKKGNVELVR